jgi:UDP-GlcNAc:undecaprenyl-phosphate GlcNAc-1-phosphate transferase
MLDLTYIIVAAQAFVLALLLVPVARRIGLAAGLVDRPGGRKLHAAPTARSGGMGIFVAFFATILLDIILIKSRLVLSFVSADIQPFLHNIPYISDRILALFLGATLMFVTGLADDRWDLSPRLKLALQIAAALPLIATGIVIRAFLPSPVLWWILTIGWVVLLTNAFNFLDNMNGLSAGVAAIAALNFYLISRVGGEYFMMGLFAALFGALLGFLRYNFPRAQLFMGDSGSLFTGYLLAGSSIMVTYYQPGTPTHLPVVAPILVLGVPLFDALSVMYIRWRNGAPLMQGDRNHFSHRLVALGFSTTQAVLFIYLVAMCVGLGAVYLRWLPWVGSILVLVQTVLYFLIIYLLERTAQKKLSNGERN